VQRKALPKSSRNDLALGFVPLIAVLLVFGIYIGVTVVPGNPGIVETVSPTALSLGCSTNFHYDSSNPISYLRIASGSTGKICVEYSNNLHNNITLPSYISVYGTCSSCDFNVDTSFEVNASQSSVSFPSSNETQIVVYTITVPSNVTRGIYGIFLLQFCSLFPMVVVANKSSRPWFPSSDFSSWYPHSGSCPAQFVNAKVLGIGGGFEVAQAY
jgi:hypothetical protein